MCIMDVFQRELPCFLCLYGIQDMHRCYDSTNVLFLQAKIDDSLHIFAYNCKHVKSVQKIRGSLSNKVIDELLKWNKQFGGI